MTKAPGGGQKFAPEFWESVAQLPGLQPVLDYEDAGGVKNDFIERAGRLHDEDIGATDVFVDLERDFRVRKPQQPGLPQLDAEKLANLGRERPVCAARKQFQLPATHTVGLA